MCLRQIQHHFLCLVRRVVALSLGHVFHPSADNLIFGSFFPQEYFELTHVDEKILSCEVNHPSCDQEKKNCWFQDEPSAIEEGQGGNKSLPFFVT